MACRVVHGTCALPYEACLDARSVVIYLVP